MGLFKRLMHRKKSKGTLATEDTSSAIGLLFYIYIENEIFGPFTLSEIKEYPILEDTLITTNTLDGEWFEAKYFECFDDIFNPHIGFRIDEDGTIIRE